MKAMKQLCSKLTMILLMLVVVTTVGISTADCAEIQPNYVGIASVKPIVTVNTNNTIVCSDIVSIKSGYTAKVTWTALFLFCTHGKCRIEKGRYNRYTTMLLEKVVEAQKGSEEAKLELVEKFQPLIRKYGGKLLREDGREEMTLAFLEILESMKPEKLKKSLRGEIF